MIEILLWLGLVTCVYASWVVFNLPKREYRPLCDISHNVSCSKAFASPQGTFAIFHNAYWGILYYSLWIVCFYHKPEFMLYFAVPAAGASLYLAHVAYVRQRNFCLVCSLIYLINLSILFLLL